MAQSSTPEKVTTTVNRDSVEYYSTVSPVVSVAKQQSDSSITIHATVSAVPFDIRHCDFGRLFSIDNDPVHQRLNWGKAILYNHVGIKLERAASEGRYNSESSVGWVDETVSFLQSMSVSAEPNPDVDIVCSGFVDIVAAHNSMSVGNYLSGGGIAQQYNYLYALNFNRYMDAGMDRFNANGKITDIRDGVAGTIAQTSVYNDVSSWMKSVTFGFSATFSHSLSSGVQTYRLSVQNPGTIMSPSVFYIYHEGDDEYYTYVDGSAVEIQGSDPSVVYSVADVDSNKIKINIATEGVFKKTTARLSFRMKKNTVSGASRL